jgi:hypothetical protein
MRVTKLALGLGAAMITSQALAGVAEAQKRKAPRIDLTTSLGSSVASNYIEPAVTLSEDAYVFVISVDIDRDVQVLHPTETGIAVKMAARRQLHLPRFFAGYGGNGGYSNVSGGSYDYGSGYSDTRGTMIALASRRPFRLSNISVGGDWDVLMLQRLVDGRDPEAAAVMLAKVLGEPGEPIGRDVYRFAGGRRYYNSFYSNSAYYDCSYLYGSLGFARGFNTGRSINFFRAGQLQQAGFVVAFAGYDACGQPVFDVYPRSFVGTPGTPGRPPATGVFPSGRIPSVAPRNPLKDTVGSVITGARPTPGRYAGQNDASTPPMTRVPDAGSVSERPHPRSEGTTVSERPRVPAATPAPERAAPRHSPPAPERVSTPRPVPERTSAPVYTPPPERASPPPPPPPPPRAEPRVERERPTPAREPKSER